LPCPHRVRRKRDEDGRANVEALRQLFTELEFSSLLKELLPVVEVTDAHYTEAKSPAEVEAVFEALPRGWRWLSL